MNVAMVLTPKAEVVCIPEHATMRQALERMERHRYAAVPILDAEMRYVGTLTEGDLLWKMKSDRLSFDDTARIPLAAVPRHVENKPVGVTTEIETLLSLAIEQNFVPVVDSRGVLMGIVTRRAIIQRAATLVR